LPSVLPCLPPEPPHRGAHGRPGGARRIQASHPPLPGRPLPATGEHMTTEIQRIASNERLSRIVIHNGVVHVAGVTAGNLDGDIQAQTRDVLAKIDGYLAQAGTDKSRLLTVQIWL